MAVLRFYIDGDWSANAFSEQIRSVRDLYGIFWTVFSWDDQELFQSDGTMELKLDRFEFASPGFQDFVGLGKIVEEVRHFITFLLERKERLDAQGVISRLAEQDLLAAKMENLSRFMDICDKHGVEKADTRLMARKLFDSQDRILELFENQQITGVEIVAKREKEEVAD